MHRRALEFTLALTLGVLLTAGVLWWTSRSESEPVPVTTTLRTEIGSQTGPADPSALVEGLIADRTGDVALTAELTRGSGEGAVTVSIRRARSGDRALDQVGATAAVFADGMVRQCQISVTRTVSCAGAQPTISRADEAEAIRALFEGPDRDYDVFATNDPLCWLLVAPNLATSLPYGRTSELCFDESERVVATRETNGREGSESYRVVTFSFDVTEADLEPG